MLQQHAHRAWATTINKLTIFVAYGACWVCLWCHNPPNFDMDYRLFIVRTDVNVCDCTRGCTDTRKRVCAESWLWEENPLPHRGIEPASAAWRSDSLTNWATSHPETTVTFFSIPSLCYCVIVSSIWGLFFFFYWDREEKGGGVKCGCLENHHARMSTFVSDYWLWGRFSS